MYTILESRPEVTVEETGVRMMSRCDDPLDWPQRQPQFQQRELAQQMLFLLKHDPRSCVSLECYFNFFLYFYWHHDHSFKKCFSLCAEKKLIT